MYLIHNAKYRSSKVGRRLIQQGVYQYYVISRDFPRPNVFSLSTSLSESSALRDQVPART